MLASLSWSTRQSRDSLHSAQESTVDINPRTSTDIHTACVASAHLTLACVVQIPTQMEDHQMLLSRVLMAIVFLAAAWLLLKASRSHAAPKTGKPAALTACNVWNPSLPRSSCHQPCSQHMHEAWRNRLGISCLLIHAQPVV